MTETAPEAAPAAVTPGQADWEARRDSSFARAGLPVGDQFVSWHRLSAEERADSEAGAQAAIAAAPPAVTVEALAAVLDGRELLVTGVHSASGDSVWLATPARPRDLAVQLLSAIDMRLTDDPEPEEDGETPGYWQVRTALTAAVHALQLAQFGTDDKLAAMARETLSKVDAVLEGPGDSSGRRLARSEDAEAGEIHPIGYQGAAQHTFTTACDGFHEPGQCPTSERPTRHVVGDDDDPWAEANAAGAL